MTPDDVRTAQRMGYPWDRLSEATFARQEAEQLARVALEPGSSVDPAGAAFDLETALAAEQRERGNAADALLLMLQAAIDEGFTDLFGKVMAFAVRAEWRKQVADFFSTAPGGAKWCGELQVRVEELDGQVRRLWGYVLAQERAIAALVDSVEALEQGVTHGGPGQRQPSEGERADEPVAAPGRQAG